MQKNYFRIYIALVSFFLLTFTACTPVHQATSIATEFNNTQTSPGDSEPTATGFLIVQNGMTRFCGKIVNQEGAPIDSIVVFFPEVYYGDGNQDGAFVLNTSASPSALTDAQGWFCTKDIAAGDYVLVIGSPDAEYEIYSEDGIKAILWSAVEGETLDIGEIYTKINP